MMFAIFDVRDLSRPVVFQDQDKGTHEPAIFKKRSEAERMAYMMNIVIKDRSFVIMPYEIRKDDQKLRPIES